MTAVPSCRRTLLTLLGTFALAQLCTAPAHATLPPPSASAEAVACSDVIAYVSRGSSENDLGSTQDYRGGFGAQLLPIVSGLRDLYGSDAAGRPRLQIVLNRAPSGGGRAGGTDPLGPGADRGYVGYRALGGEYAFPAPLGSITRAYEDSVDDGVIALIRDVTLIHQRCPSSKLALIGYSAGAEITRRATDELTRTAWAPAPGTGYAFVFGDSSWHADEPNVAYVGNADRHWKGAIRYLQQTNTLGLGTAIHPIPGYPATWPTTSWCHGADLACQYPAGTLAEHTSYGARDAIGAAARIARTVGVTGGAFAKPVVTGRLSTTATCLRPNTTITATLSIAGSPAGTVGRVTGTFGFGFAPFPAQTLTTAEPTRTVTIKTGFLRGQLSLRGAGGALLDYRNPCT